MQAYEKKRGVNDWVLLPSKLLVMMGVAPWRVEERTEEMAKLEKEETISNDREEKE
jgi:hypothetical protein